MNDAFFLLFSDILTLQDKHNICTLLVKNQFYLYSLWNKQENIASQRLIFPPKCHHVRDCMVVWFITTYAISAYHHWCCEFEPCSGGMFSIQHYVIKVCLWLVADRWISPGTLVSSTNKTDCHNITEILLKVALNTITLTYLSTCF